MKIRVLAWLLAVCLALMSCKSASEREIDALVSGMSVREKVAQLMMISADSYAKPHAKAQKEHLVRDIGVGGIIFTNDRLTRASAMLAHLDSMSRLPLLVGIDGEWGPAMRFAELPFFPRQLQLGAIEDDSLVYEMGRAVGEQCRLIGVNINFAPVVDVNINPRNPAINSRSFGADSERVAALASAYMRGMQAGGISATAKHFPGHGDTEVDSHRALPCLELSRERMDSVELVPFRRLIRDGVDLVMLGHLLVPAYDSVPTTHSRVIIKDLLQQRLGFDGIVVSDALTMRGLVKDTMYAEAVVKAYRAGVELLLMPRQAEQAIDEIVRLIESGEETEEELDRRVKKILRLKQRYGLLKKDFHRSVITEENLSDYMLDKDRVERLNTQLSEASVTDIKGKVIPLTGRRVAYIGYRAVYHPYVRRYGDLEGLSGYAAFSGIDSTGAVTAVKTLMEQGVTVDYFPTSDEPSLEELRLLLSRLRGYDEVVIGFHDGAQHAHQMLGVPQEHIQLFKHYAEETKVSVLYFGNPYDLASWGDCSCLRNMLMCYADTYYNERAGAMVLVGKNSCRGVLPVR